MFTTSGRSGLGQMESLREVPGLLAALTAGTLAALAESRVAGLGLFLTALGSGRRARCRTTARCFS
jgi:hypothetical protein